MIGMRYHERDSPSNLSTPTYTFDRKRPHAPDTRGSTTGDWKMTIALALGATALMC